MIGRIDRSSLVRIRRPHVSERQVDFRRSVAIARLKHESTAALLQLPSRLFFMIGTHHRHPLLWNSQAIRTIHRVLKHGPRAVKVQYCLGRSSPSHCLIIDASLVPSPPASMIDQR
ncbi:MAG: hypothetical protein ABI988_04175 [Nitrospirota bacterium]